MADHDYGQNGRFLKFARKWADHGYGQNRRFLGVARKWQTTITGKTGVFWNLPVNGRPRLRAKCQFLRFARK